MARFTLGGFCTISQMIGWEEARCGADECGGLQPPSFWCAKHRDLWTPAFVGVRAQNIPRCAGIVRSRLRLLLLPLSSVPSVVLVKSRGGASCSWPRNLCMVSGENKPERCTANINYVIRVDLVCSVSWFIVDWLPKTLRPNELLT
jgi:hypothetical protein